MEKTFSEYGRVGAQKFWKMFKKDPILRERIIISRKSCKGTKWIKEASRKGVEARIKKYNKKEKQLLLKLDDSSYHPLLSKLCGFLIGDGSITDKGYEISYFPDNINLAEIFVNTFRRIYKINPKIYNLKNYFKVRIGSKLATKHLNKLASFKSLNWTLPNKLLTSRESKIEFIKAFFDCEAYVGKRVIQVQSVNYSGLNSIKKLLEEFRINSKIYKYKRENKKWNTNYILCIMKKESRINYLNNIGFNHPIKQEKLKVYAGVA